MSRPSVVVATDPKGDFSHDEIIAIRGTTNAILNTIPVSASNTGFQVNWRAPNDSSLISRRMRLRGTINLQVSWTSTGAASLLIAPRQYPLHQLATTFQSWVNNQNIGGITYGEFAIPVMNYMGDEIEKSVGSAPTLGDYWTEYATATGATPTNVLGDATQSVKGRAGWAGFTVGGTTTAAGASTQTATVAINFDENFLFGGAYSLSKDAPCLTNVSTLQWAVGFSTNLSKCLSMASGQTNITTAVTSVLPGAGGLFTNLNILVDSYDPSPFMKLPAKAYYPIDRYDFQTSAVAYTVAAGAMQVGMTSPVITCPAVPARMYIFAKPAQSATVITDSDFVAQVSALQVNFDSKPLLTTQDVDGLALLSAGNGFKSYFNDRDYLLCSANKGYAVKGVVGAGSCLVFGKDIVLPDGVVSGSTGQHTIQVIATAKNQSATTYPLYLQVVLVYDEVLEVSSGMAQIMPVNVSPSEATQAGVRVPAAEQAHGVAGGGLVYGRKTGFGGGHSGGGNSGGAHTGGGKSGGLMGRLKK